MDTVTLARGSLVHYDTYTEYGLYLYALDLPHRVATPLNTVFFLVFRLSRFYPESKPLGEPTYKQTQSFTNLGVSLTKVLTCPLKSLSRPTHAGCASRDIPTSALRSVESSALPQDPDDKNPDDKKDKTILDLM